MSMLDRVRESEAYADEDFGSSNTRLLASFRPQLKRDLIERLGLDMVASLAQGDVGAARAELAVVAGALLNSGAYESLDAVLRNELVGQVLDEILGLGPIQPLLDDPTITEIVINGTEALLYERDGVLHPAETTFDSEEQIMMVVDRILAPLGRRLDKSSPLVNARLANGDRVNAVAAPVAINGPAVTIRRFSKAIISLERLVALGALPAWYAQLLSFAVRARQGIAVAGGTGSGKTTLLNALSCEIGRDERIITIEDSAELRFSSHRDVVRLEAREASIEGTGAITIRDLVKNALRMRPDRIIVGEVRGEECIDMLQAMNTGHDGSLTTLHAGTAEEAILRLVLMARFGMDLPAHLIEEQIATALDCIVMSSRDALGMRRITTYTEVGRAADGSVDMEECVSFDPTTSTWKLVKEPAFLGALVERGIADAKEVEAWRRSFS